MDDRLEQEELALSSSATLTHGHAGDVTWPVDAQYGSATPGKIGMWVFLISDAFSFAGLLIAYGILRAGHPAWRQPGEPALGVTFTALLTFVLISSSLTNVLAYAAAPSRPLLGAGWRPASVLDRPRQRHCVRRYAHARNWRGDRCALEGFLRKNGCDRNDRQAHRL